MHGVWKGESTWWEQGPRLSSLKQEIGLSMAHRFAFCHIPWGIFTRNRPSQEVLDHAVNFIDKRMELRISRVGRHSGIA